MSDLGLTTNLQQGIISEKKYPEPPRTWKGIFLAVGPGAVLAASAVGGGELVMDPRAGALYGFALTWLIILGLIAKYFVGREMGKQPIVTGGTALDAWARIHPALPITFDSLALVARGVSIAGNGLTLGTLIYWAFPNTISYPAWAVVMTIVSAIILYVGMYGILEKISLVMAGILFISVTVCAIAVMTGQTWAEFFTGLTNIGRIPSGSLKEALPLLGWSGCGAIEATFYSAWMKEKGHGIKLGNVTKDTAISDQVISDGKAWLKVLNVDLGVSYIIQTICCIAFMICGAVILHPLGIVPSGAAIATEQARLFTTVLGEWARWLFLIGAVSAMFTTLLCCIDAEARLGQDLVKRLKPDMDNEKGHARLYRIFVFLGTVITVFFSVVSAPLTLLKFGSVFDGVVLLPIAGFLTYQANKKFIPEPLQEKGILTILPLISLAILAVFMCLALVYLT